MQLPEVAGPLELLGTAEQMRSLAGIVEDSREPVGNRRLAGIAAQQKPPARIAVQVRVVEERSNASLVETAPAVQESLPAAPAGKAVREAELEESEGAGVETSSIFLPEMS
jgi:hypothetical protein